MKKLILLMICIMLVGCVCEKPCECEWDKDIVACHGLTGVFDMQVCSPHGGIKICANSTHVCGFEEKQEFIGTHWVITGCHERTEQDDEEIKSW